jgi:hypothetical protein
VDECAQHAWAGEAFQVFTWLAEATAEALDLADPEVLVDQPVEFAAPDDEIASRGRAVHTCAPKCFGFDQGEVTAALVRVVRVGANPVEVPVAFEPTACNRVHPLDEHRELGRYPRDIDSFDDSSDRPSLQSSLTG